MTENITVAMVMAARDLVQQASGGERAKGSPDEEAEQSARLFRTIYRAIAESVFHAGGGRK